MTPNQSLELKKAIKLLVKAEIANSWAGTRSAEETPSLLAEVHAARARVDALINNLWSHP